MSPLFPSPPLPSPLLPSQTALSLLEKDVLEKQATIVSLRKQLDEMKAANVKMQGQLQVSRGWCVMFAVTVMVSHR